MFSRQLSHVSPTMPAIRSMFTFGNAAALNPVPRLVDFAREMCPAVFLEHRVAEVFDAQAEPRDAEFLERVNFRLRERARLALEGDFLGVIPVDVRPQAIDQRRELLARERNDGVPPPKYTKRNGRPPITGSWLTSSISCDRAEQYVPRRAPFLSVYTRK